MKFRQYLIEDALNLALPSKVRSSIINAGGKIYQVGGAVRDEMLGKISKDLDLLVVGVELKDLSRILARFGKTNLVGKAFGIIKFTPEGSDEAIDISVPRIDSKSTGKGHKDFEVKLGKGITLQQDQLRRDFWMNAIAKDIETGEVHDIEGKGKIDIENKMIRVISPEAFKEDPLRMLRAVQFAARFNFQIEPNTFDEIKKNVKSIKTVSADRFQEEFRKMFEKGTPSIGLKWMNETGLMKQLFPQVKSLPNKNIIDKLSKKAFPAFIGIMLSPYKNKAGSTAMEKMRLSKADGNAVQDVVNYMSSNLKSETEFIKFVGESTSKGIENIDEYESARGKQTISDRLKEMKRKGKPTSLKELSVNGRDLMKLGIRGSKVGKALQWLMDYTIRHGKNDQKDYLLKIVKKEFI